jgi:dienelactone hydrolase
MNECPDAVFRARSPRFRRALCAAIVTIGLAAAAAPAGAQIPPEVLAGRNLPPITPLPRPTFSNEIPLASTAKAAGGDEQWELYLGTRIVRNVVSPTLIAFLPEPSKATGAAVIVAPGGGYMYLGIEDEERNARWLADRGVAAFVLKYRTQPTPRDSREFLTGLYRFLAGAVAKNQAPGGEPSEPVEATPEALQDGQAAVRLVRSRAKEWNIDPARVGMIGGSAGAVTALAVGLSADPAVRPDFIGGVIGPKNVKAVPPYAPPLFLASAVDDPIFPATQESIVAAWSKAKRPIEAHFYERGGHGLPKGTTGEKWLDAFWRWMEMRGVLDPHASSGPKQN